MKLKEKNYLPLNIQLFADNGEGESELTPKTYSQEDIDNLKNEIEKIKKANDNLSRENAEHKRKAKERMTQEEKDLLAQQEKDKIIIETKKELLAMKLSKEFNSSGFDEETSNELINSFNEGDVVSFAKLLSQKIKTLVENAIKETKEEIKRNTTLPPNGKQTQGVNPIVEKYINSKNSNNNAIDYYLKKK